MEDETAERETTFGIAEEEELSAPRFAVQLERSARTAVPQQDGEQSSEQVPRQPNTVDAHYPTALRTVVQGRFT